MSDDDIVGHRGSVDVLVVDCRNASWYQGFSVGEGDEGSGLVGRCGEIVAAVASRCDISGIGLARVGNVPNL